MKATKYIDKKTGRFIRQYEQFVRVCKCGKRYTVSQWRINDGRGLYCSKKCMYQYRFVPIGENHSKWSGNRPKYSALHKWLAKEYGQKMECEWCEFKSENPYKIHWANITGEYSRDKKNWARLCAKCHWHYDRRGIKPNV